MLCLARHVGEWIDVGDDIHICLVEVRGNKARIGIEAPPHVKVHRREITVLLQQQEQSNVGSRDTEATGTGGEAEGTGGSVANGSGTPPGSGSEVLGG